MLSPPDQHEESPRGKISRVLYPDPACDQRRGKGKGKRSGLRVIYWRSGFDQFWLFTVYSKNEQDELSPPQKKLFRQALEREINTRSHYET